MRHIFFCADTSTQLKRASGLILKWMEMCITQKDATYARFSLLFHDVLGQNNEEAYQ